MENKESGYRDHDRQGQQQQKQEGTGEAAVSPPATASTPKPRSRLNPLANEFVPSTQWRPYVSPPQNINAVPAQTSRQFVPKESPPFYKLVSPSLSPSPPPAPRPSPTIVTPAAQQEPRSKGYDLGLESIEGTRMGPTAARNGQRQRMTPQQIAKAQEADVRALLEEEEEEWRLREEGRSKGIGWGYRGEV